MGYITHKYKYNILLFVKLARCVPKTRVSAFIILSK